jgi:hypothetical protein
MTDADTNSRRERAVQERVASGRLPRVEPRILWLGRGTGLECDGCGEPVTDSEGEIEIEVDGTYRFHAICMKVWRKCR